MLFDTSEENSPTSLTDYLDQLNTYTNRIAGGRGVSQPLEEVRGTREEEKSNPSLVEFSKLFLDVSRKGYKASFDLRLVWKLVEEGKIRSALDLFLTVRDQQILFNYYIIILNTLLNKGDNAEELKLVLEEIGMRIPIKPRKISWCNHFSLQFISNIFYFLLTNDFDTLLLFERGKKESQYELIVEILKLYEKSNERSGKIINVLITLARSMLNSQYSSKALSKIAITIYSENNYKLSEEIFLEAHKKALLSYYVSSRFEIKSLQSVTDDTLVSVLTVLIQDSNHIEEESTRDDFMDEVIILIDKNIADPKSKIQLLEMMDNKVNLFSQNYFRYFIYMKIGKSYFLISDKNKAKYYFLRAKEEIQNVERAFHRSGMFSTIAFWMKELEDTESSIVLQELAILETKNMSTPYERVTSFITISDTYFRLEQLEKARDSLTEVIPAISEEKEYANIDIILCHATPKLYKLKLIDLLHTCFGLWIQKVEELKENSKDTILEIVIFLSENFDEYIQGEYIPKFIKLLGSYSYDSIKIVHKINTIKNIKLRKDIFKSIGLHSLQNCSAEVLLLLFNSLLKVEEETLAREVLAIMITTFNKCNTIQESIQRADAILKASASIYPEEETLSRIFEVCQKIDSIPSFKQKLDYLKEYYSIAETFGFLGKKEESNQLYQKEISDKDSIDFTTSYLFTLKSLAESCIQFEKRENAILLLEEAITLIKTEYSNSKEYISLVYYIKLFEELYGIEKTELFFLDCLNVYQLHLKEINQSMLERIIFLIAQIKNKNLALTLLNQIRFFLSDSNNSEINILLAIGYGMLDESEKCINLLKIEMEFNSTKEPESSWDHDYSYIVNKIRYIENPDLLLLLYDTLSTSILLDTEIDEDSKIQYFLDICEYLVTSKDSEPLRIDIFNKIFSFVKSSEDEKKILLLFTLAVLLQDHDPEKSKEVILLGISLLQTIEDKFSGYIRILKIINNITKLEDYKLIFEIIENYFYHQKENDQENEAKLDQLLYLADGQLKLNDTIKANSYLQTAIDFTKSSFEDEFLPLAYSEIITCNAYNHTSNYHPDLLIEYLDILQKPISLNFKISSFNEVLHHLIRSNNLDGLKKIENFIHSHPSEIDLAIEYQKTLLSLTSTKIPPNQMLSYYIRCFPLTPFDLKISIDKILNLATLLGFYGHITKAMQIKSLLTQTDS
jgi:hypothetical protein